VRARARYLTASRLISAERSAPLRPSAFGAFDVPEHLRTATTPDPIITRYGAVRVITGDDLGLDESVPLGAERMEVP
jgi:hypothetical protein